MKQLNLILNYATAAGLAIMVAYALLVIATENMPDPEVIPEPCSCAHKPQPCQSYRVPADEGRMAYVAVWGERQSCALIEAARD